MAFSMTAEVNLLAPDEASDEALVDELVRIVNAAYAVGEAGLWLEGTARIGPGETAEAVRSGGVLAATRQGRLVGCAYVRPLDEGTADLGLISVDPDQWGSGIGGQVVRSAEELMRSRGVKTMQSSCSSRRGGPIRRRTASATGTHDSATEWSGRRRSTRWRRLRPPSWRLRASSSSSARRWRRR